MGSNKDGRSVPDSSRMVPQKQFQNSCVVLAGYKIAITYMLSTLAIKLSNNVMDSTISLVGQVL